MLRFVAIEVRQFLCCANVFLSFQQPVSDFESLRINVEDNLIRLKDFSDTTVAEVNVGGYFSIRTETFSNFVVDHENISFRISLKNVQDLENVSPAKISENPKFHLEDGHEASLHCPQCELTFCAAQKYDKVREYPSGAIDVSEFFCHHGPSFSDVLLPRTQDIFYGFQFIIVNMENVQNSTKEKEGHLYCKRCNRYLGETMFDGKAVKLWTDSVAMKREKDMQLSDMFEVDRLLIPELLMLKVIKETSLPSPEPLLRNMHFTKVLLETSQPNRQQQYLLVHILEKHLPVLRNVEMAKQVEPNEDVFIQRRNVQLRTHQAFKLLYRLIEVRKSGSVDDEFSEAPILSYWQQDINTLKMKISPFLFRQLLDDLNGNSLLLPAVYRDNKDLFTLSYIFQ